MRVFYFLFIFYFHDTGKTFGGYKNTYGRNSSVVVCRIEKPANKVFKRRVFVCVRGGAAVYSWVKAPTRLQEVRPSIYNSQLTLGSEVKSMFQTGLWYRGFWFGQNEKVEVATRTIWSFLFPSEDSWENDEATQITRTSGHPHGSVRVRVPTCVTVLRLNKPFPLQLINRVNDISFLLFDLSFPSFNFLLVSSLSFLSSSFSFFDVLCLFSFLVSSPLL